MITVHILIYIHFTFQYDIYLYTKISFPECCFPRGHSVLQTHLFLCAFHIEYFIGVICISKCILLTVSRNPHKIFEG